MPGTRWVVPLPRTVCVCVHFLVCLNSHLNTFFKYGLDDGDENRSGTEMLSRCVSVHVASLLRDLISQTGKKSDGQHNPAAISKVLSKPPEAWPSGHVTGKKSIQVSITAPVILK
ncbi:hypothetical protein NDU88_005001 [Pleurodeles waltl]|uniref:Uncharacterized protein n=1 Tax=Pleurodeles waltl TaxID=8319 RepID=A0AAV7VIP9_PLEWA|nr:hypothetical protein NDU88_005001 [Pleurodeles waltl]